MPQKIENKDLAITYYEQIKQEAEERTCKFCEKRITEDDEKNMNKTIIQSTECWHQVHIECFREEVVKQYSRNEDVACPRCKKMIEMWEANE